MFFAYKTRLYLTRLQNSLSIYSGWLIGNPTIDCGNPILDSKTPLQSSTNRGFDCSPGQKRKLHISSVFPRNSLSPILFLVTSDALKYLMANHRILAQSPMGITAWLCMESPPMAPMFIMAKTARDRGRAAALTPRDARWRTAGASSSGSPKRGAAEGVPFWRPKRNDRWCTRKSWRSCSF